METDPGERQEIGLPHPAIVRKLSGLLEAWFKEIEPAQN